MMYRDYAWVKCCNPLPTSRFRQVKAPPFCKRRAHREWVLVALSASAAEIREGLPIDRVPELPYVPAPPRSP